MHRRASGVGIRDQAPVLAGAEAVVRFGNPQRRRGPGGLGIAAIASDTGAIETATAHDWETTGGGAALGTHDSTSDDDGSFRITTLSPSRPRNAADADGDNGSNDDDNDDTDDAQSDLDASGVPFVVHTAAADEDSKLPEHTPTRVPMMAKLSHGGRGSLIGVEGAAPLDFGAADDAPSPAAPPPLVEEKENAPAPGKTTVTRVPAGQSDVGGWTVCLADPTPPKALPSRKQPAATASPPGAASPDFVVNRPRASVKSDVTDWLVHDDAATRSGLIPARVEADAGPPTPIEEAPGFADEGGSAARSRDEEAEATGTAGGGDDFVAGPFGGPAAGAAAAAAAANPNTTAPASPPHQGGGDAAHSPLAKDPLARATFVAFDSPPPEVAPPTFEPAPVIPAEVLRSRCHPALVVRQPSEPTTALALRQGHRRAKVGPGRCRPAWVNPCDDDPDSRDLVAVRGGDADAPAALAAGNHADAATTGGPVLGGGAPSWSTQLAICTSDRLQGHLRRVDGFAESVPVVERDTCPPRPRLFDADPLPGSSPAASRAYTSDAVDQDPFGVEGLQSAADAAGRSDASLREDFDSDLRFMVAGASRFVAVQRAPGFAATVTSDAAAAVSPGHGEKNPLVAAGSLLKLFDTTAARTTFVAAHAADVPLAPPSLQASPGAIPPEEIVIDDETS